MTGRIFATFTLLLFALCVFGCSNSDKQPADPKERVEGKSQIVEHDEGVKRPAPTIPDTAIDLAKLDQTDEIEKLIVMTQLEAAHKLGPHRFEAELAYTTAAAGNGLDLKDNYFYEQAANGDFHLRTYNDKANKFELFWIGGKIYDRMGDVGFRYTKSDGKENYWREKITGGLARFYRYFRGHLKFAAPKDVTYEGRPALRIDFSVDPAGKTPEEALKVKHPFPNQYLLSAMAVDRMIDKNRKRVSSYDKADGYLIVDKEKKVIVAYELDAAYKVPVGEDRKKKMMQSGNQNVPTDVAFTMVGAYKVKDIGAAIAIEQPKVEPPINRDKPPEAVDKLLPKGVAPLAPKPGKPEKAAAPEKPANE